jgi:hypothetical protein
MAMLADLETFVNLREQALQARRDAEDLISDCTELVLRSRRLVAQSSAGRHSRSQERTG